MVPMLTCGLVRSNFAFATVVSSSGLLVRLRLVWVVDGYGTGCRLTVLTRRVTFAMISFATLVGTSA